jgi:hypothetical protein
MQQTKQVIYGVNKVTVLVHPTNRNREHLRRIAAKVEAAGYSRATASEYGAAVAYTVSGDERLWARPPLDASLPVLLEGVEVWLDLPAQYTDALLNTIYADSDPITSPAPLPETSDPN